MIDCFLPPRQLDSQDVLQALREQKTLRVHYGTGSFSYLILKSTVTYYKSFYITLLLFLFY